MVTASISEINMYKPYPPLPPKINFLVKPKSEEKRISKTMRAFFIFVFVTLSLNFGVLESKSFKVLFFIKSFYVVKTIGISLYLVFVFIIPLGDHVIIFWYMIYIVEFVVVILTLLFSKKTSFVDFYKDLLSIDAEMSKVNTYKPELIMIIGIALSVLYRCLLSMIYCVFFDDYCISPMPALVLFDLGLLGSDTFLIVYFTIYYSLYCRIKHFTKLMKSGNSNVVSYHFLYKSIADVYDKVKVLYNPLVRMFLISYQISLFATCIVQQYTG